MAGIFSSIRPLLALLLVFTLLLGGIYPLAVMGVAQALFPAQANGSLIERGGKIIGSELLGQQFTTPAYFWSRPSATTPPYNAAASAASNYSPANPELTVRVQSRIAELQKADPSNKEPVPASLVTASASGLDPHISVAAAQYQAGRVARARRMKEEEVRELVDQYTESSLWVLGKRRVNVLMLNLALDHLSQERKEKR